MRAASDESALEVAGIETAVPERGTPFGLQQPDVVGGARAPRSNRPAIAREVVDFVQRDGAVPKKLRRHRDARYPTIDRLVAVSGVFLLVIISVIPWRSQTIYSGGVDSVVLAKAAIALVAAFLAVVLVARTRVRMPIGLAPAIVLGFVLLLSLLGSVLSGNHSSTVVLVVRVALVGGTVLCLLACVPWLEAIGTLTAAMTAVALIAAITGAPRLLATGRLGGGLPEIHPNELAGLALVPLVVILTVILRSGVRVWSLCVAAVLLPILVATGSRTALLALFVAAVVALLCNGIRDRSSLYLVLGVLPVGYALFAFSGVIDSLATRGGETDTTSTLSSRFDAWSVVWAWSWSSWEKWIGVGLSVKEVAVNVKWRDTQVLDSSWASLLAQTGLIGTALVACIVVWCVVAALVSSRRRWMLAPILSMVVLRSVTESGLLDSHVAFVVFITAATLLTQRSRFAPEQLEIQVSRRESSRARRDA